MRRAMYADSQPEESDYVTRPLSLPEDTAEYCHIFEKNNNPRNLDVLNWRFGASSPAGHSVIYVATPRDDAEETAALYATIAVPMQVKGQAYKACQSLDTLTDEKHRRKGLFETTAADTYKQLADEKAILVYGFPNAFSNGGFVRKLGWYNLDPVPFLIRPFFRGLLPSKLKGRATISLSNMKRNGILCGDYVFGDAHDALWKSAQTTIGISLLRNARYLNWRLSRPNANYYVCEHTENGILKSFTVYSIEAKHGKTIGYVMECIHGDKDPASGQKSLSLALQDMKRAGCDLALAWCLPHSFNFRAYKRCLFFNLPDRLRPIQLHFGFRTFSEEIEPVASSRSEWYLSYLDSDTV